MEKTVDERIAEIISARIDQDTGVITHFQAADGREYLDPTPIAPPIGYKRQPSLSDQIREMVRNERLQAELEAAGLETFEDADDFEVGDDYDPSTPWENDTTPSVKELLEAGKAEIRRKKTEAETKEKEAAQVAVERPKPAKPEVSPPKPKQPEISSDD